MEATPKKRKESERLEGKGQTGRRGVDLDRKNHGLKLRALGVGGIME